MKTILQFADLLVWFNSSVEMDVEEALRTGLTSSPKYLPVWYRYDKQGSLYNDRCLTENPHYYLYEAEISLLRENIQDMISQVPGPCVLVDMGSGNAIKTRFFIDAILEQQRSLQYIPVDISEVFLRETCEALAKDYGNKLDVSPIAGDYSRGFEALKHIKGNKLIIWLGFVQHEPYRVQINRVESLANSMSEDDRLIFSLDITQDAKDIEMAYLDPEGLSALLYFNAIWRLNREYGSSVDTDKLELETKFIRNTAPNTTSYVQTLARAKEDLFYHIPGLGIPLTLKKGEYINMFEGEGVSCKYTLEQIRTLLQTGNQTLYKVWEDPKQHAAICCAGKHQ